MKNISHLLASSCIETLNNTDCVINQSKHIPKTLVGFKVLVSCQLNRKELREKLNIICGNHFNAQILTYDAKNYVVKINVEEYLVQQGGMFYKSVIQVVTSLIQHEIQFHRLSNIYA